ncbi:phosphotransferase [Actinomadura rugatobispora]|uniref:Phosphotransferase n=1 Tax=Actinomadura rugatobispora TaxID=1994 RepID=A0ABW0ZUU8_9ACTN|nr:hypothetical protein GCM10010200_034990 [Actinomadura rugatobispora]
MNPTIDHDERMRVRALGFHTRRPVAHPKPPAEHTADRSAVADRVRGLEFDAPVAWVRPCVSRRPVALVGLADGRHIVLKWPDEDLDRTGDREAEILDLLHTTPLAAATRRALPSPVPLGAPGRVRAYDAVHPALSLRDLLGAGMLGPGQIDALATALAGLHDAPWPAEVFADPDMRMTVPAPRTTLLTVEEYSRGVGAEFDVWIRAMQRLSDCFAELHRNWDARSLVHFDLRDDNVLFGSGGSVRIIDWEFAAVGDPRYDVGYLVAQFIVHALRSSPGTRPALPAGAIRTADHFTAAYFARTPGGRDAVRAVVRYAGLVLLQHAGARLELFGSLGRTGHLCLLLAEGLLRRPETLAGRLSTGCAP